MRCAKTRSQRSGNLTFVTGELPEKLPTPIAVTDSTQERVSSASLSFSLVFLSYFLRRPHPPPPFLSHRRRLRFCSRDERIPVVGGN